MIIDSSNKQKGIYISFLIYPLWSLFLSLKYFRIPQAKNLFWLFCIFLGMIHIYFPEGAGGFDGARYAQRLIDLHQQPVSIENFTDSFYEDGEFVDIYQPVVTYLFSIVTDNPRWLFILFAIVFGFFYSRNLWFVLEKFPPTLGFSLILLTIFYALICPIWEINGVRMWTAFHVFLYGALPYIYVADKSKLVWCFVSLLIHFSYFLPLTILLVYYFIPKSINFLLAFYLISSFIREIDLEIISQFLSSFMPSFLTSRVTGYANDDYAQFLNDLHSNLNFYVEGSYIFSKWITTLMFVTMCTWGKKIVKAHKVLTNMICFSLFIYGIINILSLIPPVGRFFLLCQMFAFVSFILFMIIYKNYAYKQRKIAAVFQYVPFLLILPIIVKIRIGCDFYGISLLFNPLSVIFIDDNLPIIQFIKSIF